MLVHLERRPGQDDGADTRQPGVQSVDELRPGRIVVPRAPPSKREMRVAVTAFTTSRGAHPGAE